MVKGLVSLFTNFFFYQGNDLGNVITWKWCGKWHVQNIVEKLPYYWKLTNHFMNNLEDQHAENCILVAKERD